MNRRLKTCAGAAAALLLAGCATPDSVQQLAEVTSANVGVLGTRLKQLAEESDRLYKRRADNVAYMHGVSAKSRAEYDYDLALTEKSGDDKDLELKSVLEAWKTRVDGIFAAAANAEQEHRDALIAKEVKIETKSQELQKIAESLSTLAREETREERVRALGKFAKQVRDDVKKELDNGTDSANGAKKLLDKARGEFRAPKAD
jgi:hypothetical protein